ncbi:Fpg/Nei family DNA glycosylase [Timonella senegalensis]|uniref:Fpg/Nei family DNA glycosylase n=1 Tax=Timonella senegalensis TaxID=1465825 RepID=UPI0028B176AD|nr:zinc finger domain-containing protein [Timonella senegalensis]
MPEGHTVHRLARTFDSIFAGEAVAISSPQGRFAAGAALINGLTLARSEAFGKQMFLGFGSGDTQPDEELLWLRVHLGLYGSWTFAGDDSVRVAHAIGAPRKRIGERETVLAADQITDDSAHAPASPLRSVDGGEWEAPEPRGQVRVRILSEHAVADLTGPTACEVIDFPAARAAALKLGPDPIREDADPMRFIERVRKTRSAVGGLLMNQEVIAGVGNIYRAEVLFRHNVDPYAPGNSVPAETLRAMWDDLVELMRDGVRIGAIVTTQPEDRDKGMDPVALAANRAVTRQNTDGTPGAVPRDESFYVYHRAGQPCRLCGTPIALAEMQARKLYWCPSCQR